MKILARLSPSAICGNIKSLVERDGGTEPLLLFTVNGKMFREVRGQTTMGEWVGIVGQFVCTRPDGEQFRGGRMFLPKGGLHDFIAGLMYEGATDDMSEPKPVELQDLRIMVRKANNPAGYEYLADMPEATPSGASPHDEQTS